MGKNFNFYPNRKKVAQVAKFRHIWSPRRRCCSGHRHRNSEEDEARRLRDAAGDGQGGAEVLLESEPDHLDEARH